MLLTRTRPVMRQTTTVSQKVPVADTRAWRTGLRVWAAAATIGAEPMPDSLEKRPRAIPYLADIMIPEPTSPPAMERICVNALRNMTDNVSPRNAR